MCVTLDVEGHDDAKARWTANMCVTSDVDGLRRDGPPPAEMMFKGGGEVKKKPEAHLCNSGYAKWESTGTSEKGAYRLSDVIEFLKKAFAPGARREPSARRGPCSMRIGGRDGGRRRRPRAEMEGPLAHSHGGRPRAPQGRRSAQTRLASWLGDDRAWWRGHPRGAASRHRPESAREAPLHGARDRSALAKDSGRRRRAQIVP